MGLKGCQITLDNPWNTYYAGQTVNGKVVFTFDSPKKIRGKECFNSCNDCVSIFLIKF